jgi:hypothetical protein
MTTPLLDAGQQRYTDVRDRALVAMPVDELTGDVLVRCETCRRTPDTAATRQIVRTCRASLAAAQGFFPDQTIAR